MQKIREYCDNFNIEKQENIGEFIYSKTVNKEEKTKSSTKMEAKPDIEILEEIKLIDFGDGKYKISEIVKTINDVLNEYGCGNHSKSD